MAANCHQVSPLGNGVNVPIWGYRTFGLSLASTFPLPELWPIPLPPSSAWSEVDAVIRQGLINCPRDIVPGAFHIDFSDGGITLHVASLASFQVRNAREIVVDPAPGVPTSSLRPALLGTVFALLLIYRGLAALHASVVAIDGWAVAFVGYKGAGKSTLAAAFHRHGYDLVADDILAVELSAPELLAQPGFIHMKLWPDAIAALDDDPARYPPSTQRFRSARCASTRGWPHSRCHCEEFFCCSAGQNWPSDDARRARRFASYCPIGPGRDCRGKCSNTLDFKLSLNTVWPLRTRSRCTTCNALSTFRAWVR